MKAKIGATIVVESNGRRRPRAAGSSRRCCRRIRRGIACTGTTAASRSSRRRPGWRRSRRPSARARRQGGSNGHAGAGRRCSTQRGSSTSDCPRPHRVGARRGARACARPDRRREDDRRRDAERLRAWCCRRASGSTSEAGANSSASARRRSSSRARARSRATTRSSTSVPVPPVGGSRQEPVVMDSRIAERESIVLEAGTHEESIRSGTRGADAAHGRQGRRTSRRTTAGTPAQSLAHRPLFPPPEPGWSSRCRWKRRRRDARVHALVSKACPDDVRLAAVVHAAGARVVDDSDRRPARAARIEFAQGGTGPSGRPRVRLAGSAGYPATPASRSTP